MASTDGGGRATGTSIGGRAGGVLPLGATDPVGATGPATSVSPSPSGSPIADAENPMKDWITSTAGVSLALIATAPGALEVKTTATGPLTVWTASGDPTAGRTPATPGKIYTVNATARAMQKSRTVAMYEVFYNADNQPTAALVWGQSTVDSTTGWTTLYPVTALAPPETTSMAFGVVFYDTAQGEAHQIAQPVVGVTPGSSPAVHGPLTTSGNSILDATGTRIVFRGINRVGMEDYAYRYPRDAEIAQVKAWGANFVRLPLSESLWLNTCGADSPTNDRAYPAKVDYVVDSITSRGMVALLDLHKTVMKPCTKAQMQAMADTQYATEFWKQVAARYKNNPLVAFNLYNEPRDISDSAWLKGGTVTWAGVTYNAIGMQTMYNIVRDQGANNLVFVAGNRSATRPPSLAIKGKNIVYAAHDYTCVELPCSSAHPFDGGAGLTSWSTFSSTHPVMVTEFGWPNLKDGRYAKSVIAAAEARGWGWSAFAWDGTSVGLFSLVSSMGTAYEPSPAGIPVLAGLTKN